MTSITIYISHHRVTNVNKPGKVRDVYDSAAEFNNTSLNTNLLKVPDLLNNLIGFIRFCSGRSAIMAGIEQMFHQIYICSKDRDSLRFLWRNNPFLPISEFFMNVHLFDSLCCTNWTLKRTALDTVNYYPKRVTEAVLTRFYMDDYKSSSNKKEAINMSAKVKQLLSNRGFSLTKFSSNNHDILKLFSSTNTVKSTDINLDLDKTLMEQALAVVCLPEKSTLKIKSVEKKTYRSQERDPEFY